MSQAYGDFLNVNQTVKSRLQETVQKELTLSSKLDATLNTGVLQLKNVKLCSQEVNAKPFVPARKRELLNDSHETNRKRSVGGCNKVDRGRDKKRIYRNRENPRYCEEHSACLSDSSLGNPEKGDQDNRIQAKRDAPDRNAVEGKLGEGKRSHELKRMSARLRQTNETMTALQHIVLNLERKIRTLSDKMASE